MIENCTLYLPIEKPPLKTAFPKGRSDGGLLRTATWFEYETVDGAVRLNLQHPNLHAHLRGFRGYVAQLPDGGEARAEAQALISRTKTCLGVFLPGPVSPESDAFASLIKIIDHFGGFMFVADSIMLPDGSFLVGPMADSVDELEHSAELEIREVDPQEFRHQGVIEGADAERIAMRERNYLLLAERGFRCARWLPLYRSEDGRDTLRPPEEIATRLLALSALFLWVSGSEEFASSDRLGSFVARNGLDRHLTPDEGAILALPRPDAKRTHANSIGWRLENIWALAWVLGFDPAPPFLEGQLPNDVRDRLLNDFVSNLDATVAEFMETVQPRTVEEVGQHEDLYYCAHNAVRSAQTGEDTVPRWFHPVRDGGAVQERRHALTWALSPGTAWDDTDLST